MSWSINYVNGFKCDPTTTLFHGNYLVVSSDFSLKHKPIHGKFCRKERNDGSNVKYNGLRRSEEEIVAKLCRRGSWLSVTPVQHSSPDS